LEQAHRRAVERGLVDHAHRALGNLASIVSDDLARYDTAVPLIDRALAFAEQYDLDAGYAWLLGQRAKLRLERGDWSGAFADADTALARSGPRGVNAVLPFTVRGRIQAARGDPEAMTSLDEAARQADRVGDAQWVSPVVDARAEYFLWAGDADRAQEEARRGIAVAGGSHGPPFVVGRLAYRLWEAGGTDEPPANTAEPFRMMINGAWAAAAAEWGRRGGRYLQAEALAAGDEDAAAAALQILDELGATRAATTCAGSCAAAGSPGCPAGAPDDRRARRRVDRPAGGDPRDGRCGDVQGRDRRAARRVGADRGPPRLARARQAGRDQPPPSGRDGRADGRDDGRPRALGAVAPPPCRTASGRRG